MNRKEKIKMLQAISEKRLPLEALKPPNMYYFFQYEEGGPYCLDDKPYTLKEYKDFCEKVDALNNKSVVWHGQKACSKIITFVPDPGCEPINE